MNTATANFDTAWQSDPELADQVLGDAYVFLNEELPNMTWVDPDDEHTVATLLGEQLVDFVLDELMVPFTDDRLDIDETWVGKTVVEILWVRDAMTA